MNKQRKVLITTTYNEMGIIIDTKVEEVTQTNLQPASTDTISMAKAIDGKICIRRSNGVEIYDDYVVPVEYLEQLPPAQPAPSQVAADIARIVENGKDMRVIEAAQHTPDQTGDLWITVPDIDKVTCIYVQESKSKFCRIFYEEQPERIKGHWIVKPGSDAPPTCDKCGYESRTTIKEVVDQNLKMIYCTAIDIKSNFCPNCGAEMEVTE